MGKGPSAKEQNVTKELPKASDFSDGSSSGSSKQESDNCVFSFRDKISLSLEIGADISTSAEVVIVPNHINTSRLDLYINGKNAGEYKGNKYQKILDCIKQKYQYVGLVEKINNSNARFVIQYKIQGFIR